MPAPSSTPLHAAGLDTQSIHRKFAPRHRMCFRPCIQRPSKVACEFVATSACACVCVNDFLHQFSFVDWTRALVVRSIKVPCLYRWQRGKGRHGICNVCDGLSRPSRAVPGECVWFVDRKPGTVRLRWVGRQGGIVWIRI